MVHAMEHPFLHSLFQTILDVQRVQRLQSGLSNAWIVIPSSDDSANQFFLQHNCLQTETYHLWGGEKTCHNSIQPLLRTDDGWFNWNWVCKMTILFFRGISSPTFDADGRPAILYHLGAWNALQIFGWGHAVVYTTLLGWQDGRSKANRTHWKPIQGQFNSGQTTSITQ